MIPERIGGWRRLAILIGIVLSVAWIGAMLARGSEHMHIQSVAVANEASQSCEQKKGAAERAGVWRVAYIRSQINWDNYPVLFKPGFIEAFGPLLLAWLFAYGCYWVVQGFAADRQRR